MRLNRFAAAAVLAASALALTACDPDASTSGGASAASSAAPSAGATGDGSAPSTTAPTSSKPAGGAASPGKSGAGSAKATAPADGCQANAAALGTVVVAVDATDSPKATLKARATKFVCGPDVPGEGYFEAVGDVRTYEFAPGAQASVLIDLKPKQATPEALAGLAMACAKNPASVPAPQQCYGNQYGLKLDAQGRITSAAQLYHP